MALLAGHEQVVFCTHPPSGLRAIIAVHSTALGPALGGTRMRVYADEQSALADVLRLARAMTYKNALAGLPHGGGKAVILADPARDRTPELLRAYGRFVQGLCGRYITACDVGTGPRDMDVVALETSHVTGRSPASGGAGDSGVLTALGVVQAMRAAAHHRFGGPSLAGRRVGVVGLGKVGSRVVDLLVDEDAEVVVADVDTAAVQQVTARHPQVSVVAEPDAMLDEQVDVLSPNALGGSIDASSAQRVRAAIICGGANNQLTEDGLADVLAERDVLYVPDYVANSGGVIQVADELRGYDEQRANARALGIAETVRALLQRAARERVTPAQAADRLAEERLAAHDGRIWLPSASEGWPGYR